MKTILVSISCFLAVSISNAQTPANEKIESTIEIDTSSINNNEDDAFTMVDTPPSFEGGMQGWYQYISNNLHFPKEAKEVGVQGKVFVQFIISETGKVEHTTVLKGVNESINAEALKVVANSPDWTPGEHKGHKVKVKMVLPITFTLDK